MLLSGLAGKERAWGCSPRGRQGDLPSAADSTARGMGSSLGGESSTGTLGVNLVDMFDGLVPQRLKKAYG